MSKKTISNKERIEGLMNIAANNKLRGSKFIKPSYSALGNMIGETSNPTLQRIKARLKYN